jgi:hypothetical protein
MGMKRGHEVAWEEFVMPLKDRHLANANISGMPSVTFSENNRICHCKR